MINNNFLNCDVESYYPLCNIDSNYLFLSIYVRGAPRNSLSDRLSLEFNLPKKKLPMRKFLGKMFYSQSVFFRCKRLEGETQPS